IGKPGHGRPAPTRRRAPLPRWGAAPFVRRWAAREAQASSSDSCCLLSPPAGSKPAAFASSAVLNQTSATVQPHHCEPATWYFCESRLRLTVYSSLGAAPSSSALTAPSGRSSAGASVASCSAAASLAERLVAPSASLTTARFGLASTGSRTSSMTHIGALSPLRGAILVIRV